MKQNQFELKPFQQVLVKDGNNGPWKCGIFSHYNHGDEYPYSCVGSVYKYCIPYNENTAHLLGTTKPYEKKIWKVTCHKDNTVFHFTNDEFKHFIETAVVNNKDIQWFTTTYDE